jgi:hypothetical protein
MTAAQIIEIIGSDRMNVRIALPDITLIAFNKDKNVIFSEVARTRFLFDTVNEILEVSYCRPYSNNLSDTPEHEKYDQYVLNGQELIFEYLTDSEGNIIKDYYTFNSIRTISFK